MRLIDLYKDMEIDVIIPKGFMNVGVARNKDEKFPILIADTNDSANWDELRIPLPPGDWVIGKYHEDGKTITLRHYARRRTFFSPWF